MPITGWRMWPPTYFMAGDKVATGDVMPWTEGYRLGKHTITVTAYSVTMARGTASTPPGFSLVNSHSKRFIRESKNGDVLDAGTLHL